MNNKTARFLRTLAEAEAKKKGYVPKWTHRQLKALWKATPRDKKDTFFV